MRATHACYTFCSGTQIIYISPKFITRFRIILKKIWFEHSENKELASDEPPLLNAELGSPYCGECVVELFVSVENAGLFLLLTIHYMT